jgi:hypothetical protein
MARARLTFAQKVELLNERDTVIRWLRPGIARLNAVRNRCVYGWRRVRVASILS